MMLSFMQIICLLHYVLYIFDVIKLTDTSGPGAGKNILHLNYLYLYNLFFFFFFSKSTALTTDASGCICPGDNITFYCTVAGPGEYLLFLVSLLFCHSQFKSGDLQKCGHAIAQTIGVLDSTYNNNYI